MFPTPNTRSAFHGPEISATLKENASLTMTKNGMGNSLFI